MATGDNSAQPVKRLAVVDAEGKPVVPGKASEHTLCKVCYGLLFYTAEDAAAGREPVRQLTPCCGGAHASPQRCYGLPVKRAGGPPAFASISGHFRFSCAGRSFTPLVASAPRPGGPVQLPYCEGVEVTGVAKTTVMERPVAAGVPRPEAGQGASRGAPPVVVDLNAFSARFQRSATKIATRMRDNAKAVAAALGLK